MFGKQIPLFNLFGFKVQLDLSWLLIAFLLVWTLAGSFFPMQYEGLSEAEYIVMGIVGVVGLFASIIAHEFMHAYIGRRFGVPIKGLTLFLLGGIAEMKEEPKTAKSEFWMAIAGPLASIVVALIFYFIYRLGINWEWRTSVVAVLSYLWRINVVLVIFNMIPAFPLDGGRILRSILWRWKGQIEWATKISSTVGIGFGIVLMILGVLAFLGGNPIGGLWYFLIGIFIRLMARSSYQRLLILEHLKGDTVNQFMNPKPITVGPDLIVHDLIENYFYRYHHKMFPVVSGDKVLGCVMTSDISKLSPDQWNQLRTRDIMQACSSDNSVESGKDVFSVITRFVNQPSTRVLVLEKDRLLGIVNTSDILNYLSLKLELKNLAGENEVAKQR